MGSELTLEDVSGQLAEAEKTLETIKKRIPATVRLLAIPEVFPLSHCTGDVTARCSLRKQCVLCLECLECTELLQKGVVAVGGVWASNRQQHLHQGQAPGDTEGSRHSATQTAPNSSQGCNGSYWQALQGIAGAPSFSKHAVCSCCPRPLSDPIVYRTPAVRDQSSCRRMHLSQLQPVCSIHVLMSSPMSLL